MTRTLSASTTTEKGKTEASGILTFVDVFLDSETLHFVHNHENIDFFDLDGAAATYNALKMKRSARRDSIDMTIQTLSAGLDNVDQAFASYIASQKFIDRRLVIRACFRNLVSAADNAWKVFDGFMDKPVITKTEFAVELVPRLGRGSLDMKLGIRQQLFCRLDFAGTAFGGTKCPYGISAAGLRDVKSAQTVDSGDTTYVVDAARTEADDYWNKGYITFADDTTTAALRGIVREIKDFVAADDKIIPVVSFPAAPAAGDTYTIERGCDRTLETCENRFSNEDNYGGVHTLPDLLVIR